MLLKLTSVTRSFRALREKLDLEPAVNQRVGSPEIVRKADGTTNKPVVRDLGLDRLRLMPNPNLPGQQTMKTVGATNTVLPLQVGQTVPAGTLRAGNFQRVDAVRAQALGSGGAVRRFDENAGAPYYNALAGARELDAARRSKDLNRVARTLEGMTAEEIGNVRLVWKSKMGPESLDVALRGAFPQESDRLARLLRGRPTRG